MTDRSEAGPKVFFASPNGDRPAMLNSRLTRDSEMTDPVRDGG